MNTHIRDNLLETAVAKVTTAGDVVYATGATALARLAIGTNGQIPSVNSGATALAYGGQKVGAVYAGGNTGAGTVAIDWNNGNVQTFTMTGNCTFTAANPVSGGKYTLILLEDATGSRVPTWFTIKWPGGVAPTLSGANKKDIIILQYDGTDYLGSALLNL